ncbi:MAG: GTPase ObgE [Candidatus Pacebacteria bacterium]|nr:GTPase ObgE [Candidatus Paceibacterota bacterium]
MLTDEVKIKVSAGDGGNGVVAFDKVKMSLGPTGGRGGNGGDVYFQGVSDVFALRKYRHKREYWAPDGKNGRGNRSDGPAGKDLILTVPIGTVLHNLDTKRDLEITKSGQKILVAKGGVGGRGNFFFRSSTNTSPEEYEEGKPGQEFNFELELRLIADVGLIGLPSAGKSSLLNELTAAAAKVAPYHFTTLEPNLGDLDGVIIADIPGLIEGASAGRGLGIKFLRHIQRTKFLLHCISLESPDLVKDYKIIRKELENYNPELIRKREVVLLTKTDLVDKKMVDKQVKKMQKLNPEVLAVSVHDWEALAALKEKISQLLR